MAEISGFRRIVQSGALFGAIFYMSTGFQPVHAQVAKAAQDTLDNLSFSSPQLRLSETLTEAETLPYGRLENLSDMDRFRSENGTEWHFLVDERTGRVNLLEGGAIPFIPGPGNDLHWADMPGDCHALSCVPVGKLESLARNFLFRYQAVLKVNPDELVLDPVGSVPVGNSIYFLRFQWVYGGVPVDNASVFMAINNGNLIQVGLEKMGDIKLDPVPTLSTTTAWEILDGYIGGMRKDDEIINAGTLAIMPMTPRGMDPDMFDGRFGKMIDYALVYKLAFRRPGVMGTWEALVDAHTGEILRFNDVNAYGHIQGGVYKTDAPFTEVTVPFPYANYGSGVYSDPAGNFAGTSGTCTMVGPTSGSTGVPGGVKIVDSCGSISMAANGSGLIDFGNQGASGTDCSTPGVGGAGNTHAARTQYWNVTQIKMKAISYLPTNTWLKSQLTDKVNISVKCNAYWDGSALNFFKAQSPCGNTGEIPGVSLHEWGHGMDANDGSGSGTDNIPVETRADWTALLQTHQSCTGAGFLSSNCGGYGDPCTGCTGVREADYAKHQYPYPWTPQNNGKTGATDPHYSCSAGSYNGPCGWEDHCESGIATQALWDFATRDLVGPPTNMDIVSAWQLADRLFYTSMPQAVSMYTCTGGSTKSSNGCGAGSIYNVYRAVDDDGDGLANGTPHAAAIFSALNRHGIACGLATDAANQNETSCPSLTTPTLSGTVGNNQDALSWTSGGANATRYLVFRNETSCSSGFTRIATVSAPTLTYTDTNCYNGVTYYYRIQAAAASDSCTSPMSNCVTLTPSPCTTPGVPAGLSATAASNTSMSLSWTAGSPAGATYNVYRSSGVCPGVTFTQVASGIAATSYADSGLTSGTTYSYEVAAVDSTGGCVSGLSACANGTTSGPCGAAPTFVGLTSVTNPGNATCTLVLGWSAATPHCGTSVYYNVYRSTTASFTPSGANRIATGVVAMGYTDTAALASGTPYYYEVRSVDVSNGVEDTNAVIKGATPTGPTTINTLLTENWDGATVPALPSGWATAQVVTGGTNGAWATHVGTRYPSGIAAHSGSNLVFFNSWTASSGDETRLYRTSGLSLAGATSATLTFWMYHDTGYSTYADTVQVQYSLNGTSWTSVGAAVNRYDGSTGWKLHTIDLSAADGNASVQIGFLGLSAYGNDCHIDDVTVTDTVPASCSAGAALGSVKPVPDGLWVTGTPDKATKTAVDGSAASVTWDTSTCTDTNYNLYYGNGSQVSSYVLLGSQCGLGISGTYAWSAVPAVPNGETFLWWIIAGTDGVQTESSWGKDSAGNERHPAASGQCGFTAKSTASACP